MSLRIYLVFPIALIFSLLCSCHVKTLLIDPDIADSIADKTIPYFGSSFVEFKYALYKNDSIVENTFSSKFPSMGISIAQVNDDTLFITAAIGRRAPIGFEIRITKDSIYLFHTMESDEVSFSKSKDQKFYYQLLLPIEDYKIILNKKPDRKKGEEIKGMVEFMSPIYYTKTEEEVSPTKIHIKAFFTTKTILDSKE
jgi:hypothetical protein